MDGIRLVARRKLGALHVVRIRCDLAGLVIRQLPVAVDLCLDGSVLLVACELIEDAVDLVARVARENLVHVAGLVDAADDDWLLQARAVDAVRHQDFFLLRDLGERVPCRWRRQELRARDPHETSCGAGDLRQDILHITLCAQRSFCVLCTRW